MRLGFLLAVVLGFGFLADACIDGSYPRLDNRPVPGVFADKLIIGPQEGTGPDYPGGAPVLVQVSGRVTFDRWAVGPGGVDGPPVETSAAFVLVEAVSAEDYSVVIRTAETDAAGDYSMTFTCTMDYFVRARAQSGTGNNIDRVIHPRTKSQVVHAVTSQVQPRTAPTRVIDLRAQWPWDHGGAFQVLDTVRRLRVSVGGPLPQLGPLDVFWSHHNFYDGEFVERGMVAGTFTDQVGPKGNPTIYLMGGRYRSAFHYQGSGTTYVDDHDEEDETVIAHEWASFLQLTRSRDNNFGGIHAGEELLPTASYSEGVVTAIGCALLDRRLYRDSAYDANYDPFLAFEFDLESGVIPGTGTGYGSEFVTTRVVWDLLDGDPSGPDDFDADGVAIPMADFLASFTRLRMRATPYEICWLPSLLQQLIDDGHLTALQADALVAPYGESFPPAGGPEVFPDLVPGVSQNGSLDAFAVADANPILGPDANAVYRLVLAAPTQVDFILTSTTLGYDPGAHRLEFSVHALDREVLALEGGDEAVKTASLDLPAGTYLVRVQHRPATKALSQPSSFTLSAQ